jgi:AraC-like DNA-binding protein
VTTACGWTAAKTIVDPVRLNAGLPYLFLAAWERFRHAEAIVDHAIHPGLRRACSILAADPALSATDLAEAAGVSRFHLARLFRAKFGTMLLAWRSRLRVERALELRRAAPGQAWTAIALDSGFGSYAQFHRAFTAACGVPPRRWSTDGAPHRPASSCRGSGARRRPTHDGDSRP